MSVPCEVAVKCVLPAIRAIIAKELTTKYQLKQREAAKILGVSQPAISLYYRKIRGKAIDLENDQDIKDLVENMAKALAKSKPSHRDLIPMYCETCRKIRAKGLLCKLHKVFDPAIDIEGCELCFTSKSVQSTPRNLNTERLRMVAEGELKFIGIVEKAGEQKAKVKIFSEFCAGLKGTADFSHLIILYWMHLRDKTEERKTLLVSPKRHAVDVETGVFACRSPSRPNPIGLSIVELVKVEGCILTVKGLDADEASPIIDIKPYLPRTDSIPNAHVPEWTRHGPQTG